VSSDNKFDQVDALIESDERQSLPPAVEAALAVVSEIPGAEKAGGPPKPQSKNLGWRVAHVSRNRKTWGAPFNAQR
jgi:hypothetical protein